MGCSKKKNSKKDSSTELKPRKLGKHEYPKLDSCQDCCQSHAERFHRYQPPDNGCVCNQKYENFPYKDLPPPAPPNGRDDLWDLQFCRWWGWNWVRRREEAGSVTRSSASGGGRPKRHSSTHQINQPQPQPIKSDQGPSPRSRIHQAPPTQPPKTSRPLPTKKQLKEMCKCLIFGQSPKSVPPPALQNLYNTPSNSVVMMERYSYGVADRSAEKFPDWRTCAGKTCRKKTRREKNKESRSKIESWSREKQDPELDISGSEEVINHVSPQKFNSSTEESIEYLSIRLQHINSDMCCPCQKHNEPKPVARVDKQHLTTQTSQKILPQEHKEIQTFNHSENDGYEKTIKLKGKKRTICLRVCCCGCCKGCKTQCNGEKGHGNQQNIKKCSESCNQGKDSKKQSEDIKAIEEPLIAFPLVIPPPNTNKMFSKFGTPSKNYSWLQGTISDNTLTTLHDSYKSPLTGKTYDLSPLKLDSYENVTLPDVIDITEDLSYLKKIKASCKSGVESRILLDAVCDAILTEDRDSAANVLDEFDLPSEVREALGRDWVIGMKTDATATGFGAIEKPLMTDVSNMTDIFGVSGCVSEDIGAIMSRVLERKFSGQDFNLKTPIFMDLDGKRLDKRDLEVQREDFCDNVQSIDKSDRKKEVFKFRANENPVFTKTGLLSSRNSEYYRGSSSKRCASASKEENESKRVRQEDKGRSEEINENEEKSDQIGTIFNKIEDIVKQSKVKSAEIKKVLSSMPQNKDVCEQSERNVVEKCSFRSESNIENFHVQNGFKNNNGNANSSNIKNTSKRSYAISPDHFENLYGALRNNGGQGNPNKISYEIFSQNLDSQKSVGKNICDSVIAEGEENREDEDNLKKGGISGDKQCGTLSMSSFVVCDGKPSNSDALKCEKKVGKKKKNGSKGSLIPVRKPTGENSSKKL